MLDGLGRILKGDFEKSTGALVNPPDLHGEDVYRGFIQASEVEDQPEDGRTAQRAVSGPLG